MTQASPGFRRGTDRQRICVLIRRAQLPGGSEYLAAAFLERSAAEAVRATLPLAERARAEIRELDIDDLRPRPR